MTPYKRTDRAIRALNKRYIQLFEQLRGLMAFDELNVLGKVKQIYTELASVTEDTYVTLMGQVYDDMWVWLIANGWAEEADKPSRSPFTRSGVPNAARPQSQAQGSRSPFTRSSVRAILEQYDPVTKYVYQHEIERKQARCAESIISSANAAERSAQIDTAMRLFAKMAAQYAVELTDESMLQAYRDANVDQVIWVTVKDERRCKVCRDRDGRVYPVNAVPPKPHYNCRCYLLPYRSGS